MIDTDVTELVLDMYSNVYSAYPAGANCTVRCDGMVDTKVFATANATLQEKTITLPTGRKLVTIFTGQRYGETRLGTYLWGVSTQQSGVFNVIKPTVKQRVFAFIGDSVANGYLTTDPSVKRYASLMQDSYPNHGFIVEGSSGISLNQLNAADTGGVNTITRLLSNGVTDIVFCVGLNDYGQSVPLATHELQLTAWVNTAKSLYPTNKIYLQSLSWTTEVTTINGNLPSAFRTVQQNVSTNTGVNFIDGRTRFSQVNMADGSHPNDTGHLQFAESNAITFGL